MWCLDDVVRMPATRLSFYNRPSSESHFLTKAILGRWLRAGLLSSLYLTKIQRLTIQNPSLNASEMSVKIQCFSGPLTVLISWPKLGAGMLITKSRQWQWDFALLPVGWMFNTIQWSSVWGHWVVEVYTRPWKWQEFNLCQYWKLYL